MRAMQAAGMPKLLEGIRELQHLRRVITRAEHQLAARSADGGMRAADRFAERARIGAMRHDDARLTARLRSEACGGDASVARRFDRLMLLVDEVAVLEVEAEMDPGDRMRRAMAQQAAGELAAEAAALLDRVAALPPQPALRLVDQVG